MKKILAVMMTLSLLSVTGLLLAQDSGSSGTGTQTPSVATPSISPTPGNKHHGGHRHQSENPEATPTPNAQ